MSLIYWIGLAATFGAFAGACMRLLAMNKPERRNRCQAQWLGWGAVHIGIALACAGYLADALIEPRIEPAWYTALIRFCLAALLLVPWRRRDGE